MSKTMIWVSGFFAAFLILLALQLFTEKEPAGHPGGMPMMQQQSAGETTGGDEGKNLTASFGCITCHGADLRGTNLAPSLAGLNGVYDRDKLINYMRNPQAFMDADRYRELKIKYKNVIMPAFNNRDVKDLGKIADYVLKMQ